jgi:hypothetical protein
MARTTFKKAFFYLITLLFIGTVVELFVLVANYAGYLDDFFDHSQIVMSKLNHKDLYSFLVNQDGDPILGWNLRGPQVYRMKNCAGIEVELSYDKYGARTYPYYDSDSVTIITVGDSFTHGSETGDAETYPAQLAVLLGETVVNHGVYGYGPVQSFLNLKQKIHLYPQARTVILGVMYGNVYRMMNSYRPAFISNAKKVYGLKPYMSNGDIQPHPGKHALEDIDIFRKHAKHALENDFWAKPTSHFPYSLSLLHSLTSNYLYYIKSQQIWRKIGIPDYFLAYRSDEILNELFALLNKYVEFAQQNNLKPVVVFIPRNGYDTDSAGKMIDKNRSRFPHELLIGNVADAAINWDKYNLISLEDGGTCHPSAYGYQKIAEYVANLLKSMGVRLD